MLTFLIIYVVIALLFFCIVAALQMNYVNEFNKNFKFPIYKMNLGYLITISIFFPITIIICIIAVILDYITEKK